MFVVAGAHSSSKLGRLDKNNNVEPKLRLMQDDILVFMTLHKVRGVVVSISKLPRFQLNNQGSRVADAMTMPVHLGDLCVLMN